MRQIKKTALLLTAVFVAVFFAGCGSTFDASAYVKAILDNSYKNDSTEMVKQGIAAEEEASDLFEEGLDIEMEQLVASADLSEELQMEYRAVFEEMFQKADYTVDGSEKQEDGSYVVTVRYKQLKVFAPAFASYQEKVNEFTVQWTDPETEYPEDAEMYDALYTALKDCLKSSLETAEYGEEASTTLRVELVEKQYMINEDDLYGLENLLFDIEAVNDL